MAKYLQPSNSSEIDAIFHALSDSTRRDIIERLTHESLTVSKIADKYEFALPTISKHLNVLEASHLVSRTKKGRYYHVNFEPETMKTIAEYVAFYTKFWNKQIDSLERFLKNK